MKEFIKKHVIVSYLLLTFLGTGIVYAPLLIVYGNSISLDKPATIPVSLLIGVFPTLASFLVTYIKEGKLKGSTVVERIKKKSSGKLYLLILCIMPSYMLLHVLFSNLLVNPYRLNVQVGGVILALCWGICSTFGEEFGWRGLVLPHFLQKYSLLKSGILLGIIWGLWHIPMNYIGCASYGSDIPLFVFLPALQLVFDSTIIAIIFVKSNGNLKATLLYHFTLTSMTILEVALWESPGITHTQEAYTNLIGYVIKFVFIVLLYCSIRKRRKTA